MTWWHDVLELIFAANAIVRMRQRRNRAGPWSSDARILQFYFESAIARATPDDAAWIESGDLPDPQSFLRNAHNEDRNIKTRYDVVDFLLKDIAFASAVGHAKGLVRVATRLYEMPMAHPAPDGAYEELAQIVRKPIINDRRGFAPGDMPLPRFAAPLLLEGLSCESCGRRHHQLRRGLFRTDNSPSKVVCGTRCQSRIPSVKDSEISPVVEGSSTPWEQASQVLATRHAYEKQQSTQARYRSVGAPQVFPSVRISWTRKPWCHGSPRRTPIRGACAIGVLDVRA